MPRSSITATSILCALLCGCASSLPKSPANAAGPSDAVLNVGDHIDVNVSSATSYVALRDSDKRRIAQKISQQFQRTQAVSSLPARHYRVDVAITRYYTGNEFIRAMLAGPDQIQTDALVRVSALMGNMEISEFKVSNIYPTAGIYGATSRIEDIEDPFAQSVADALQGRGEVVVQTDRHPW